jgi:hypothetical protein
MLDRHNASGKAAPVRGSVLPETAGNTAAEHGFRKSGLAKIYLAPASLAAFTRTSRSRGRSVISGSTGAQITPASTPAEFS